MRMSRTSRRDGVAAVEFAIIAPILVVLILGTWEFGRMIQAAQILNNAAREGGRQAAGGTKHTDEVREYVLDYLRSAGVKTTGMPQIEVQNLTDSSRYDTFNDPNRPESAIQGDEFRITIRLPTANVRWVLTGQSYFGTSSELTARTFWRSLADQPVVNPVIAIPE
jgi:Flp pilus assembly protein TadG